MDAPTTPPPPYPPPHPPLASEPWPPPPPAAPPRQPRRSWRGTLAAGVAGGVLATAVALPVGWRLAEEHAPDLAAQQGSTQGVEGDNDNGVAAEPFARPLPDITLPDTGRGATGVAATDDQSEGVLLLETKLVGGGGAGTAMVLTSSGLALTNYHVVEDSTAIKATVASSGRTYDAEVVGYDEEADVALIQLLDAEDLATVDLDDDDLAVDDAVTAVGNALGQRQLLAATGRVRATDEQITAQEGRGRDAEALTGMIETDAAVVSGYSGGPMYDDEGEVVGITTATSTGSSQSYAVPIEKAMDIVEAIRDGDEGDGVRIGPAPYLGVSINSAAAGVLVESVEDDGAAAEAGLTAGSAITGLDGTPVSTYADLAEVLAGLDPGDRVAIAWTSSDGAPHTVTVELGESPLN